jgi:hypothetical protein
MAASRASSDAKSLFKEDRPRRIDRVISFFGETRGRRQRSTVRRLWQRSVVRVMRGVRALTGVLAALMFAGCAGPTAGPAPSPGPAGPTTSRPQPTASNRPVSAQDGERLRRIMDAVDPAMNNPRQLSGVKVGIMDDPRSTPPTRAVVSSTSPAGFWRRPTTST